MSQSVQTWTYTICCHQNPELCEYYHDQIIIAFDSTRLGVVFFKQTEEIERVIINTSTDSIFYIVDSLQLGYAGSQDGMGDSLAANIHFELDSNYAAILFGDTVQVYVSKIAHENQRLIVTSWIPSAGTSIPIESDIILALIPFLNNVLIIMPTKAIVQSHNSMLNLELVYELISNTNSQGSAVLEIDDEMTIRSLSQMY